MHLAQAAFEYMAYTKSTKHFGMDNVTLGTVVLGGLGLLVFLFRKKGD